MKIYKRQELEENIKSHLKADKTTLEKWLEDPFYIDGDLVSEFWRHIENAPGVAVIGDYDCDGITASYIMTRSIKDRFPDKKTYVRIPKRFSEGYGINKNIIEEIKNKLPKGSVVITVDNGISAGDLLESLEKDGYPVLMTDHHSLREGNNIPKVTMAIDPSVSECSKGFNFTGWCGAAVAFKLSEQVVSKEILKDLETMAGIATVADCMELTGGNWGLVRKTINNFREGNVSSSIKTLLIKMKQDPKFADEDTFGYYLGPCFNASGRLYDNGAKSVLQYLLKPTIEGADKLVENNEKRRAIRDEQYEQVVAYIEENGLKDKCPIWAIIPDLHEGIVGILAGKVAEDYGVPAIILTQSEETGIYKGSARSAGDINIFEYLTSLGDVFERMGGHAGAAGLSMTKENFDKVKDISIDKPTKTDAHGLPEGIFHINASLIPEINDILKTYKPFGEGNPAPLFDLDINAIRDNARMIGSEKNHLVIDNKDMGYKITHWFHDPNSLSDKNNFGMYGCITDTNYAGKETPTFNAEGVHDIDEREK